jgi:hypothetical protein
MQFVDLSSYNEVPPILRMAETVAAVADALQPQRLDACVGCEFGLLARAHQHHVRFPLFSFTVLGFVVNTLGKRTDAVGDYVRAQKDTLLWAYEWVPRHVSTQYHKQLATREKSGQPTLSALLSRHCENLTLAVQILRFLGASEADLVALDEERRRYEQRLQQLKARRALRAPRSSATVQELDDDDMLLDDDDDDDTDPDDDDVAFDAH